MRKNNPPAQYKEQIPDPDIFGGVHNYYISPFA